ncbi:MAG: bicarbonate transporter [Candidatus Eremiobacteraeota bacterium]|nr:bicarbonate transporter [Candidatus Eremiobacteraeota bacterium]
MQRVLAGSLAVSFFLIPLYPAFITLTRAPVPGISLVPAPFAVALFAFVALIAVYFTVLLLAAPRQPMPTLVPMAAFPAAALVAAVLGFDPLAGAVFIAILTGGVIWHAAILRFVRDRGVTTLVFGAYLLSGALASLAAIVMVLAKTPSGLYTIGHGRAIGTFVLPGELAGYLILYVPVAFALARARLGLRSLAVSGLVLAAVAFVLTFSRAGWVGMAAAAGAFVLLQRRGRGARYAAAIMGTALVAVLLLFNAHHDPSENFTRLSIWAAALRTMALFPFSGVGPFEFAHVYPFVRFPGGEPAAYHAHSIVLTIAAETGLIGVAALLFGWWRFAAELRARLQFDSAYGGISVAIAAGLAGTWVQGLIDTISIVIFGLWLPFMALALACAETDAPERSRPSAELQVRARRRVAVAAAMIVALLCAFVQTASSSVYAFAASPLSLAAHLPPRVGARMYEAIERVAPPPVVERVLAEDALRHGDLRAATEHAGHIPSGEIRSDIEARIAAAQGRTADAVRLFLAAGDDEALQPVVTSLQRAGRIREAYELESRIRDRLTATGTRPNTLADSWWRLGRLAVRLGNAEEAAQNYERAVALAPLNTKYLLDAGTLSLARRAPGNAERLFTRAGAIDPADADAIAGIGLAQLQRGAAFPALNQSQRADKVNSNATLARRLREALRGEQRKSKESL